MAKKITWSGETIKNKRSSYGEYTKITLASVYPKHMIKDGKSLCQVQ